MDERIRTLIAAGIAAAWCWLLFEVLDKWWTLFVVSSYHFLQVRGGDRRLGQFPLDPPIWLSALVLGAVVAVIGVSLFLGLRRLLRGDVAASAGLASAGPILIWLVSMRLVVDGYRFDLRSGPSYSNLPALVVFEIALTGVVLLPCAAAIAVLARSARRAGRPLTEAG